MLTFILVTIAVFYLAGVVGRALLRGWVRRRQQEYGQGGSNPFFRWGTGQQEKPHRPEGEITIERTRTTEKKVSRSIGEYVEYEEVAEEETTIREQ